MVLNQHITAPKLQLRYATQCLAAKRYKQ